MKTYIFIVTGLVAMFGVGFAEMINNDLFSIKYVAPFFLIVLVLGEMVKGIMDYSNFRNAPYWFGSEWLLVFVMTLK